jgi:hydroxyacylglutathione hydrolase
LVNEEEDPTPIVRRLVRLGYDDLAGTLSGGMLAWHMAGRESSSIATVTTYALCERLDEDFEAWILDVRSDEELEREGRISDAHHIHITQLPERLDEVPMDRPIRVFCGSGLRSMIGASLLEREGWKDVSVILGGLAGWHSTSCPAEF